MYSVVISKSSGLPQSNIAVPLYSSAINNNGNRNNINYMTLLGLWSGRLNLTEFSETLQSLNLTDGELIVYVDQNNEKVADSNKQLFRTNQNESFAEYASLQQCTAETKTRFNHRNDK